MGLVQQTKPARRAVAAQSKYTAYRDDLRADFNGACGYCDDSDEGLDRILFHIDHFAPQARFRKLETEYTNLVYACRFCNICKSNHWVGDDPLTPNDGQRGFIDPCSADYELNLERDDRGRITAKSPLGTYIIRRLKLNLVRHELLWNARRLRLLRDEADAMIVRYEASGRPDSAELTALLRKFRDLTNMIKAYELGAVNA